MLKAVRPRVLPKSPSAKHISSLICGAGQFAVAAMKKRLGTAMAARLLLLAPHARHSRRPAATRRCTARRDVDDDDEMFDSAEAILQREATLKIGNVRHARFRRRRRRGARFRPGIEFRGISVAGSPELNRECLRPVVLLGRRGGSEHVRRSGQAVHTVRDKGGILAGDPGGFMPAAAR